MTLYCIFCGSMEESEVDIDQPVCDRPECLQKAKQAAFSQFLETFIEHKNIDGQHMFRFRANASAPVPAESESKAPSTPDHPPLD